MMGRKTILAASLIAWALSAACGGEDGPTNPPNQPGAPVVTINGPPSESAYTVGQRIEFRGSAMDDEDGAIPDSSLVWSSNREGEMGSGGSFDYKELSAGSHTITLTATDSDGKRGTATISVTIEEVPELPPVDPGAVVFLDDLDSENGGVARTNYSEFGLWNVTRPCVDLHGPGSIDPMPGNGLYIDMDGSCNSAGELESKEALDLPPGNYRLELVVGGNNQLGPTDTMHISVGGELSTTLTMAESEPFQVRQFNFSVSAATTGRIVLDHEGGDQQGILIDTIRLRRLP